MAIKKEINIKRVTKCSSLRKENLKKLCGNKCNLCGYNKTLRALEFHHIIPAEKSFQICDGRTRSIEVDIQEVEKCILVCANCHREIHEGIQTEEELWERQTIDPLIKEELLEKAYGQKNYCKICGKEILKDSTYCSICAPLQRITEKPVTKEELKVLIRSLPFTTIGKMFNVSDNGIRKWCKRYGLPYTKKEINSYSDKEWEKI